VLTAFQALWSGIDEAKLQLECRKSQRILSKQSMKEAERKVASRAKMIFESGTLNLKREELYRNIMMLSEMRRDAKDLSPIRIPTPKFRWPLTELRKYALSLYQALQAVRGCDMHKGHYVNLKLDCRLKADVRKGDIPTEEERPSFTLTLAPTIDSSLWYTLQVDIIDDTPTPWRAGQRVRFLQQPTKARRAVKKGLCATLTSSLAVSFGVDSENSLHEMTAAPGASVSALSSAGWVSMQEMLTDQHTSNKHIAELDYAQIMSLGLTLVCSFLQLYLTEWVPDEWTTADVVFLQHAASTSYNSAFVQLNMVDGTTTTSPQPIAPSPSRRLLALAAILLELGTLKPMAELSQPTDRDEHSTIRRCVSDGHLDTEPPCFREAIEYCLECNSKNINLATPSAETLQEITGAVVSPFQRDLKSLRMAVPP
jgi:hypothetical protein